MTDQTHDRIEQIEAMRLGTDYRFPISVRSYTLMVRPLSLSEVVDKTSRVLEKLSQIHEKARTSILENSLIAKETLIMASTSRPGANDPKITEYVLDLMTPDEISLLHRQYVMACERCNPALESLTITEIEELVQGLKKNLNDMPSQLIRLSFTELVSMAHYFLTKED